MQPVKKKRNPERGDTVLEFAVVLPLFLLLLGGIGLFAWAFWAQAAADVAASRALQAGSLNRGGDAVSPGAGIPSFQQSLRALTGGQTAGAVGSPEVSASPSQRLLHLDVLGQIRLLFGPLDSLFQFGGGGAGRLWRFWPGPPSPWE
jgi:hypothetical protein